MPATFTIPDLACGACADKISQAIHAIDPQAQLTADPQTKLVTIDSKLPITILATTIVGAGYTIGKTSPNIN
jgi:copper chaperone